MQLLLTDRLTCPRCGPAFGLILLANDLANRRVRSGVLGCPNCRDSFSVDDGFADLRAPPRGPLTGGRVGGAPNPTADEVDRVVALLGIHRGPGTVLTLGAAAVLAAPIAASVDDLLLVAIDPDTRMWPEQEGVTRMTSGPGLPFFDRTLRGCVVDGRVGPALLFEAARVVARLSRVVVLGGDERAAEVLREGGLEVLAQEGETIVAARS